MAHMLLYHGFQQYEWATKYHFGSDAEVSGAAGSTLAAALADAESPLMAIPVVFTRAEGYNAAGDRISEYTMDQATYHGTAAGDMMNIKYAWLIRLVSGGPKRASTKYIHGVPEGLCSALGAPTATALSEIDDYGLALNALGVNDSDGNGVEGASFRHFTRRRRLRRFES